MPIDVGKFGKWTFEIPQEEKWFSNIFFSETEKAYFIDNTMYSCSFSLACEQPNVIVV